ncbi:ADP-ribosylglycohydrolase family protein [Brachybacterium saurashtrense]|uniref:ADP-ribosylglycohydrolase family protein n=1 Tax=Brachybacterium saurashtrense TaxID=556288 RepID=A0A345YLC0_9MICO|nr:ADP-ribosylglycohydrolase family protein [Brachybacterium saurashtrense]AXK44722.1 ADP-ribosylglycohydrolase family protein [Brachybacterium saurashtrense]RRR23334.1 ADP-ribosylglycohydrolase family protein [Brachybacterium saurashtrense]
MTPRGEGLTPAQRRRAAGAVVAAAAGDALGAPYEFQPPVPDSEEIEMIGGGVLDWQVGEWTDDTAMAIVVLEASLTASDAHDLRAESAQDHIAREWYSWSLGTPDIGTLTSHVVRTAADLAREDGHYAPRARDFRAAAASAHEQLPASAGNGSLMRAHAAVLPYLLSPEEDAVEAVTTVCRMTHVHPDTVEASVLWGLAVRHAIRTGEVDVRAGLAHVPAAHRETWLERIEEAEQSTPVMFRRNGWVVGAFQAAWAAVVGELPLPPGKFAQREAMIRALEVAVRAGYDTDTVACITGALMGAALGPKAVPPEWRRTLFGWPGYEVDELEGLVERVISPMVEDEERTGS